MLIITKCKRALEDNQTHFYTNTYIKKRAFQ
jgi:hypothetical protein